MKQIIGYVALVVQDYDEAEKDGRTYHLRDTHWNAHGNRIAGKQVADFLLDRLSLGQDE